MFQPKIGQYDTNTAFNNVITCATHQLTKQAHYINKIQKATSNNNVQYWAVVWNDHLLHSNQQ